MNQAQSHRSIRGARARSTELGFLASFRHFFKRLLDEDKIVLGDYWLKKSGVQQQLEFEGFQLRWVQENRLTLSVDDGWDHVTVRHRLWWIRRVRRPHGGRSQYLMKKEKSFRSRAGY